MLFTQRFDLVRGGAKAREHAPVLGEEPKAVRPGQALQFTGQLLAQGQHGVAHVFQLGLPVSLEFVIGQDGRHDTRAVVGREAVVLAVEEGQSGLVQPLGRFGSHQHQDAGPLAVDPEVLGAACRDQALRHRRRHFAGRGGIGFQPVAKALIGDVDHRHGTSALQHFDHRIPFTAVKVRTGRVVAAAVQQDHIALLGGLEVFDHPIEVHAAGFAVEITVVDHFHPQIGQDRQVVRPCRVRHKNARIGVGHTHQFKRLTHSTGATGGGGGGNRAARHGIAQHKRSHRVGIGRIAGQTGVHFGVLVFPDALLGGFDGAHHRGVAAGVFVDTDAEVDLRVARVFAVGLYKGEDLVSGLRLERLEHGVLRLEGN